MKALVVSQPGGDFEVHSVPTPEPEPGHVLVRIQASCINPLDTKIRAGAAAHAKQPLPAVLGLDMAGVVERVGKGVLDYSVGDEVFGMVGGVGGHQGTLAEYISVPAVLLAHKPRMLSMHQASALPLVTITAWEGLIDRAKVHAGQTVLVHAGAGGVGHIVVQLARAQGSEVFATVSPEKQDVVVRLGATPIDYRSNSVEQYVQKYTNGAGFDIVYDTVGGSTLDASFHAAKTYTGHVVSCLGWGSHSLAPLSFRAASYSGVFTLLPLLTGRGQEQHGQILRNAAALADAGKLIPMLASEVFTPERTAAAFDLVAAGTIGKVVVDVSRLH
jgi:NADPH:quinone reductase